MADNLLIPKRTDRLSCFVRILILPLAVLLTTALVCAVMGLDVGRYLRDPASQTGASPMLGVVSNLGVLAWAGASIVALFAGTLLRGKADGRHLAGYFTYFGLLLGWLMLDDWFMLHENVFKGRMQISESNVFAAYGLILGVGLWRYRRAVWQTRADLLGWALLLSAGSLIIDHYQQTLDPVLGSVRVLAEDGLKFLGASFWFGCMWYSARDALLSPAASPAIARAQAADPAKTDRDQPGRGDAGQAEPQIIPGIVLLDAPAIPLLANADSSV